MPADLVIRDANVWTIDEERPRASAIAVEGDRISWVGEDAGATVLPGFVDAHNHVRLGSNPGAVRLAGAATLDEIRERIADHLREHPDATWVEGEGWNYAAIPGGTPDARMLEGATGGRPAFLFSYDVHTVWMNREAIDALGIIRETHRLAWGTVEHDPATGEPTGYVHDFAVLGISEQGQRELARHLPSYDPDVQYARLLEGLDQARRLGITTIVEPQNGLDDLTLFARARDEGRMSSRLIAAMLCLPGTDARRLDALEEARATYDDDRFRVAPLKLYIDDVIEPRTAAMLEPYEGSDGAGDTFWEPEAFAAFLREAERRGFQTFTHATGDRGIRTVLDAVESCRRELGPRDARHQIVHVECVHPDDLGRFAELGVVACMQPRHCAPDLVVEWRANVGPARERHAWPFRSIAQRGGALAFSSDWNVAEMDPMVWLYTALTRADLRGRDAWNTDETVDLETAVRASTLGGAFANFAEHDRGVIVPGRSADIAVLSRDLDSIEDPSEILDTHVTHTIVGGETVFRSGDASS